MELTLVRHGEPALGTTPDERFDPGLSERGRAEAYSVAGFLLGEHHDALYVSPLRRARETAQPIAEATGLRAVVEDGLAEFDQKVGYTHFSELRATRDPRYGAYLAGDLSPWGTDLTTFRSGVCATLSAIIERHPGQRVLVVSHGGVQNAFLADVLGVAGMAVHAPAYASVSRFRAGSGRRTFVSANESGHLRGIATAGLPDHILPTT